jgi:exonuclease VII small subunit
MKTKMNLRPIARMSFAAVAFLAASSAVTVKAGEAETTSVMERLETIISNTEETLKYKAPESATLYMDEVTFNEAVESLEVVSVNIENSLNYRAPEVTEDIEAYELEAAMERLESFHLALEESIKF